jgi:hypothetical protein
MVRLALFQYVDLSYFLLSSLVLQVLWIPFVVQPLFLAYLPMVRLALFQ